MRGTSTLKKIEVIKMYILIRREEKKGKHYEHTFYSPQIPRLIGYTNYRNATERFQWKIVAGDVWEWRQINRNYRVLDYIPIVNAIKSFVLQLKYKIYKNEMCIGNAFFNGIHSKNYFQVYNKKYFCCPGNTNIIRPLKKYKWTIENDKRETVVNIEQEYGRSIYKIERLDTELSVELIMLSIMHIDMTVFSREGRPPITAG